MRERSHQGPCEQSEPRAMFCKMKSRNNGDGKAGSQTDTRRFTVGQSWGSSSDPSEPRIDSYRAPPSPRCPHLSSTASRAGGPTHAVTARTRSISLGASRCSAPSCAPPRRRVVAACHASSLQARPAPSTRRSACTVPSTRGGKPPPSSCARSRCTSTSNCQACALIFATARCSAAAAPSSTRRERRSRARRAVGATTTSASACHSRARARPQLRRTGSAASNVRSGTTDMSAPRADAWPAPSVVAAEHLHHLRRGVAVPCSASLKCVCCDQLSLPVPLPVCSLGCMWCRPVGVRASLSVRPRCAMMLRCDAHVARCMKKYMYNR
jgi:hypothetical protein